MTFEAHECSCNYVMGIVTDILIQDAWIDLPKTEGRSWGMESAPSSCTRAQTTTCLEELMVLIMNLSPKFLGGPGVWILVITMMLAKKT